MVRMDVSSHLVGRHEHELGHTAHTELAQQTEKALVSCEKDIDENKKARPEEVYLQELEQMDTFT